MKISGESISLGKRLFGFVGVATTLVIVASAVAWIYYSRIERSNSTSKDVSRIVEKILTTRVMEKAYLQFFTPELKQRFGDLARGTRGEMDGLRSRDLDKAWRDIIGGIGGQFDQYGKLFEEIADIHAQQTAVKEEMGKPLANSEKLLEGIISELEKKQGMLQMDGENLSVVEYGILNTVRDLRAGFLQLQGLQLQYLLSGDESYIQEYKKIVSGAMQKYFDATDSMISSLKNASFQKTIATVKQSLGAFMGFVEKSQALYAAGSEKIKQLDDLGTRMIGSANTLLNDVDQYVSEQKKTAFVLVGAVLAVGMLLFWTLSVIIVRSITKPINYVIRGLTESAQQVAAASGQVSSASKVLAEGTSEQASAIEETSSALEEMSSMTKQSAESASIANQLMAEAKQTITTAKGSMERLTASMADISKASDETQKIIKSIDEIAFQTNLLALNAAVEAARAGEAGAGFAVVAEEVRSLAKRAAEAAKNTAGLIEATGKTIRDGSGLAIRTNEEFSRVAGSASKVGELVDGIAVASREQSEGIEQVNRAIVEMDKVVQHNAASAEESASASMEMDSRAAQVEELVGELVALVHGGGRKTAGKEEAAAFVQKSKRRAPMVPPPEAAAAPAGTAERSPAGNGSAHNAGEVDPKKVIPFGEEDFADF